MARLARLRPAVPLLCAAALLASVPPPWGHRGHAIVGRSASSGLPADMPAFFRARADQLAYLNYEPDRWMGRSAPTMERAFTYDHFVNLEQLPPDALGAPDRWTYLRSLVVAGLERPERVGFLPFRIVELYQRLVGGFRLWRGAPAGARPWIEDRIVNDAGILGHYVADAANPHHTTIHHDRWDEHAPNPEGYTTRPGFHERFESDFVDGAVRAEDVLSRMSSAVSEPVEDVRRAVLDHIMEAHAEVERLYRLDRDVGFDPEAPDPEAEAFAVERLVAGSEMLRRLWWSAWVESGAPASDRPPGADFGRPFGRW